MTENGQDKCGICLLGEEGIHCVRIDKDPFFGILYKSKESDKNLFCRVLYKNNWRGLMQPFIAKGRIEDCGRYKDPAKMVEPKRGKQRLCVTTLATA